MSDDQNIANPASQTSPTHVPDDVIGYFLRSSSIPLIAADISGKVHYTNAHVAELLGLKPSLLTGINLLESLGERDRMVLRAHLDEVIVQKRPAHCEVELLPGGGTRRWIRLTSVPGAADVQEKLCWSAVENISQVRRLEKAEALYQRAAEVIVRAESLADFSARIFDLIRLLFGFGNGHVAMLDPNSGMILFPYHADERDPHPVPRKPASGLTDYVITTGRMLWLADSQMGSHVESSGFKIHGTMPVDWIGLPLIDKGRVLGMIAVKSYEEGRTFNAGDMNMMLGVGHLFEIYLGRLEAEGSQRLLRTAIEQAAETVMVTDTNGHILYVNPAFEKSTGFSPAQVIGKTPAIIQSGKHDRAYYEEMWRTLSSGEVWRGQFINRKKDGTLYEEEAVISPVRNAEGVTVNYVAVKRDLTRESMLERQYLHAQKMEVVNRMVERIRHDFSNLLMIIRECAEDLRVCPELTNAARSEPAKILEAVDVGEQLIGRLATFASKTTGDEEVVDLNLLVQSFEPTARQLVGERYDIHYLLAPRMESVRVDRGLVEQVLSNILMNAADAMPQGGTIEIRTLLAPVTRSDVVYLTENPPADQGSFAIIEVADQGPGIPHDAIAGIFDPDASARTEPNRIGFGLATSRAIMRKHQGLIGVKDNLPAGTVFRLCLPPATRTLPEPVPLKPIAVELPRGSETILLAEDDEGARRVISRMLQDQGYNVLEAESGAMAIRHALGHQGVINLLLSDMMMPDFDGRALSEQIVGIHSGIRIIFISGYSRADLESEGAIPADASIPLLKKPFRRDELIKLVRETLDNG